METKCKSIKRRSLTSATCRHHVNPNATSSAIFGLWTENLCKIAQTIVLRPFSIGSSLHRLNGLVHQRNHHRPPQTNAADSRRKTTPATQTRIRNSVIPLCNLSQGAQILSVCIHSLNVHVSLMACPCYRDAPYLLIGAQLRLYIGCNLLSLMKLPINTNAPIDPQASLACRPTRARSDQVSNPCVACFAVADEVYTERSSPFTVSDGSRGWIYYLTRHETEKRS